MSREHQDIKQRERRETTRGKKEGHKAEGLRRFFAAKGEDCTPHSEQDFGRITGFSAVHSGSNVGQQ